MYNLSKAQYESIINQVKLELKTILREEQDMMILKEYQMYDFFYGHQLNEGLSPQSKKDLRELQNVLGSLGKVCARLMYRLIKWGAKKSVKLCVKAAQAAYRAGKENSEICKNFLYALLFFCIGYGGNTVKEWYNNKPIIEGTTIEQRTINGVDSLVVYEDGSDVVTVVQQPNKEEAPVVKKGKKKTDGVKANVKHDTPIWMLSEGETKITNYSISNNMVEAIADTETFVDHLYDTKDRNHKLTLKDLKDPKRDITIGYGRCLKTYNERKAYFGKTITKAEAMRMFKEDLRECEIVVNNALKRLPYYNKVNFSQNFYDVLCSIVFNAGSGNIFGTPKKNMSEFWRRINNIRFGNNGKYIKADIDYAFAKINTQNTGSKNQGGLKKRRRNEYLIATAPDGTLKKSDYNLLKK